MLNQHFELGVKKQKQAGRVCIHVRYRRICFAKTTVRNHTAHPDMEIARRCQSNAEYNATYRCIISQLTGADDRVWREWEQGSRGWELSQAAGAGAGVAVVVL